MLKIRAITRNIWDYCSLLQFHQFCLKNYTFLSLINHRQAWNDMMSSKFVISLWYISCFLIRMSLGGKHISKIVWCGLLAGRCNKKINLTLLEYFRIKLSQHFDLKIIWCGSMCHCWGQHYYKIAMLLIVLQCQYIGNHTIELHCWNIVPFLYIIFWNYSRNIAWNNDQHYHNARFETDFRETHKVVIAITDCISMGIQEQSFSFRH